MRLFGFSPTRATRPAWALAELDIDYEPVTEGVFKHPELKNYHPLGRITTDDYDKKCHQLKTRQYQISDLIKKHLKADETFKITVNTVFSIASMAYELFESSKIEQIRKLITYVFSNLE